MGTGASAGSTRFARPPVFDMLGTAEAVRIASLLRPFSAVEGEILFRSGAPVERLLRDPEVTPEFQQVRWLPLPGEALSELHSRSAS